MADHEHPNDFQGRSMIPQGTQENGVPFGHEESDANIGTTLVACIIVLSSTLVVMLAMAGMFNYLNNREKAKDVNTPPLFARRVDPPKPWLLPSPQQDQLPWVAFEEERRAQEATGVKIGIIDRKTGIYKVPGTTGDPMVAQQKYFANKHRWEHAEDRYSGDVTGGRLLTTEAVDTVATAANDPYPGHTMTQPPQPARNPEEGHSATPSASQSTSSAPGSH